MRRDEAEISYQEPILIAEVPNLQATWLSDVFVRGAAWSVCKHAGDISIEWADLAGPNLGALVRRLLLAARESTPNEYGPD